MGRILRYYLPEGLWYGAIMVIVAMVIAVGNLLLRWEIMQSYIFSMPLLWMILPPICSSGLRIQTDLAIGFGAARRQCFWAQQIVLTLFCLEGLVATQLLYQILWQAGNHLEYSMFGASDLRMNPSVSLWLLVSSLMVTAICTVALRLEKGVGKGLLYAVGVVISTASYLLMLFENSDLNLGALYPLYPLQLSRPGWGVAFGVMIVIWLAAVAVNRFQMEKAVVKL